MRPSLLIEGDKKTSGNVAVTFAFLLFPILLAVAFTIDTARQIGTSRALQFAADAAALAGAQALQDGKLDREQIESRMVNVFDANKNFSNWGVTCGTPKIAFDDDDAYAVNYEMTCQFPTLLGKTFAGKESIVMTRSAHSTIALPTLDIALMLDMSGSMDDGARLPALKAAAKQLTSTLITTESGARVRVALVPYGEAVNAGVYGNRAQGKSDTDDTDGDGDKVCVTHRDHAETRFTDAAPVEDHYVGDLSGSICKTPMIVPLTNDVDTLHTQIDNLTATGYDTAGHIGLAWSWYTISSNWNQIWPEDSKAHPNDQPSALKAVVMMSDGVSNRHHDHVHRNAYRFSATDTMALCQNMREAGIVIYAVGLNLTPPSRPWVTEAWLNSYGPETVFESCVADPSQFYQPTDSSELIPMYAEISQKLDIESVKLTE